jgi:hypothetical protein
MVACFAISPVCIPQIKKNLIFKELLILSEPTQPPQITSCRIFSIVNLGYRPRMLLSVGFWILVVVGSHLKIYRIQVMWYSWRRSITETNYRCVVMVWVLDQDGF